MRTFFQPLRLVDDRAIEDYDTAIRLNPNHANALNNRGRSRFYLGQFTAVQPDLIRAVELKPDDVYTVLWLYQARARAGQDGRGELGKNAQRFKLSAWPGQVIRLYLGNASAAAILQAAKDPDPKKDKEQHCEAYFYPAEHALLRGDRAEAIRLFKGTIATSVINIIEYAGAQAELRRLGY